MRVIYLFLILFLSFNTLIANDKPLIIAIKAEPSSLDPQRKKVIWDQFIAYNIFETLTQYSKQMKAVPSLATSWSNPDPLTWIIEIKKGVKFHNGDPLTTEDIIFTFDRIKTKYKSYGGFFSKIQSYEIVDNYTFKIKTYKPYNSLYQFNNIFIVPKKYILKVGDEKFAKHPIGSGYYKYVSGDTKEVNLSINKEYKGKKPFIDNITIKYLPRDKHFQALLHGDIDISKDLIINEFDQLKNHQKANRYIGHSNLYNYLGMDIKNKKSPKINTAKNPFLNPKVRLAIAKAINIKEINKEVFKDKAFLISQLANSSVFGFNPKIKTISQNIQEAKKLLQEAGYKNGFELTLNTPLGVRVKVANIIARQLKEINLDVKVEPIEDKLFWKEIFKENHSYSFFIAGFAVGQSVEHSLNALFATRKDSKGRLNFTGYTNKEVDKLLAKGSFAQNVEDKLLFFQKANHTIMEDRPIIPLYNMPQLYGLSKRVDWRPKFSSNIRILNVKLKKEPSMFESIKNLIK